MLLLHKILTAYIVIDYANIMADTIRFSPLASTAPNGMQPYATPDTTVVDSSLWDFSEFEFSPHEQIVLPARQPSHAATELSVKEKVIVINYKKITDTTNNWMFLVIFISLLLFGWMRLLFRKQISLNVSALIYQNFAVKSLRNSNEHSTLLSASLYIVLAINASLFAYQAVQFHAPFAASVAQSYSLIVVCALAILILYSLKHIALSFFGFVCNASQYAAEYLYNVHLYNKSLGFFLFPIIIAFAFIQPHILSHSIVFYAGVALIASFFFLRILRGIQISIRANVSILYMFLYFCIFEVLPIALLIKLSIVLF